MNFWDFCSKLSDKINFKHILTLIVIIFAFLIFHGMLFGERANTESQINIQIITAIITFCGAAAGYWLNSSASSAKKDEALMNSTPIAAITNTTITSKGNTRSSSDIQKEINNLLKTQSQYNPATQEYQDLDAKIAVLKKELDALTSK